MRYLHGLCSGKNNPHIVGKIKNDLSKDYRLRIKSRGFNDEPVSENRVIHVESGNYMCHAPVMIMDRLSGWYFFITNERSICFRVDSPVRTMLEFYSHVNFDLIEYLEFKKQVTEIFEFSGFYLSDFEGEGFTPHFPVFKEAK